MPTMQEQLSAARCLRLARDSASKPSPDVIAPVLHKLRLAARDGRAHTRTSAEGVKMTV